MTDLTADLFDTAPPAAPRSALAKAKTAVIGAASAALLPAMKRIAPDHIGGETLDDAWRVAERLGREGLPHTLGFWDAPGDTPAEVAEIYRQAIARTRGTGGYVSIKPPALRFDLAVGRDLARAAAEAGVRLHCDSHGINVADLTLDFAEALLADLPPERVSVTVPGRWARSPDDAARLLARGVGIRIVKGEWPDPADPGRDLKAGFLDVAARAAKAGGRIAIASHDAALVTQALQILEGSAAQVEVEFIFGLQTPALLDLAAASVGPARIYVPFGRGFVPSALKALRRRPALALGVLKHMVRGRSAAQSTS